NIAEPPLFLDLLGILERPRMGEHALLEAGEEDGGKLEALGRVEGHERDAGVGVLQLVDVAHQRDRIEKALQRGAFRGVGVILGGGDQLLEVLQPSLGLGRAIVFEALPIAGGVEEHVDQRGRWKRGPIGGELADEPGELLEPAGGLAADVERRLGGEGEQWLAVAYLRLLVNPADDVAFRRAVGAPTRGIGATTLARLDEVAARDSKPLLALAAEPPLDIRGKASRGLEEFPGLIRKLPAHRAALPPPALIDVLLNASGYRKSLEDDRSPESEARLENLE